MKSKRRAKGMRVLVWILAIALLAALASSADEFQKVSERAFPDYAPELPRLTTNRFRRKYPIILRLRA